MGGGQKSLPLHHDRVVAALNFFFFFLAICSALDVREKKITGVEEYRRWRCNCLAQGAEGSVVGARQFG